jgi:hypothetical protein
MPNPVVHMTWPDGTTFTFDDDQAVRRDGVELGEQGGDFTPHVVDLDGEKHVLVAGIALHHDERYVEVNGSPVPINTTPDVGQWMAPPIPFESGMTITVIAKAALDGDELWRLESPPLSEDRNEPVWGPGWTHYAPLE